MKRKRNRGIWLLGDIGGSRARLALFDPEDSRLKNLRILPSKSYSSIEHLLSTYLNELTVKPESAVLALAGPVISGRVQMTNLGWEVNSKDLRRNFKFNRVALVNDLQAVAYSIYSLRKEELFVIRDLQPLRKYPKAFLAPGTGLGVSVLVSGSPTKILATEAGHTFFSPISDEEWEFSQFLLKKGILPVWEEVLSGRGLTNIFEFFTARKLTPEEIVRLAEMGEQQAIEVISLYLKLLGRKCHELTLCYEPFGGIFITGGVALAMGPFLREEKMRNSFLEGYFCNEKLRRLLDTIPILLILHPNPGLLGVQTIARSLSK